MHQITELRTTFQFLAQPLELTANRYPGSQAQQLRYFALRQSPKSTKHPSRNRPV